MKVLSTLFKDKNIVIFFESFNGKVAYPNGGLDTAIEDTFGNEGPLIVPRPYFRLTSLPLNTLITPVGNEPY